jgi:hypothetical protein
MRGEFEDLIVVELGFGLEIDKEVVERGEYVRWIIIGFGEKMLWSWGEIWGSLEFGEFIDLSWVEKLKILEIILIGLGFKRVLFIEYFKSGKIKIIEFRFCGEFIRFWPKEDFRGFIRDFTRFILREFRDFKRGFLFIFGNVREYVNASWRRLNKVGI